MGDKMFNVTRNELDDHERKMRENRDADILMMDRLFTIGENLQKKCEKLEIQLAEETRRRIETEEQLAKTKAELEEARNLINELTGKLNSVTEQLEKERQEFKQQLAQKEATIEGMKQSVIDAEALLIGLKYLKRNVDSFRCGRGVLEEPCGACMLPDGKVVVSDTVKGLFLFSHNTELIKHVQSDEWKWPQGLVYDRDMQEIMVTMRQRIDKDKWMRVIGFFDLQLQQKRTLLGPSSEIGTDNTAKESLTTSQDGMVFFLSVVETGSTTIYRLNRGDTKWHQIVNKAGATMLHLQVVGGLGPIIHLFALEMRMANLSRMAVSDNDIADRRTLATVERPGAICVDADANLFIHDKMTGKITVFDTYKFEKQVDLCLVDDDVVSMTASMGYLGIAVRGAKSVLIFRYRSDATALAASED